MLYRLMWFTIGPLIRVYWWVRPRGRRNVPRGGVILASNHRSAIDPILICMSFARTVNWLAKVEVLHSRKVAWFFRWAEVIPVDRGAPDDRWLDAATAKLRKGHIFGVFPEGTRSPDGRVYKGYTGVARLAERSGAPVVPAAVVGTDRSHTKGRSLARPARTQVRFGAPLRFEVRAGEDRNAAYHRFTEEVLDRVADLAGAERVRDRYSRERAGEGTRASNE
jgi:1-acyl-sn-glycerol-3-phosphate acyltransferase